MTERTSQSRRALLVASVLSALLSACLDHERVAAVDGGPGAGGNGGEPSHDDDDGGSDPSHAAMQPSSRCPAGDATLTEGPLLGAVSDRSIKVWLRGDHAGTVEVVYWPVDQPDQAVSVTQAISAAKECTALVQLEGLSPATRYRYRARALGGAPGDEHGFATLPAAGSPLRTRFVTLGDVNGTDLPGFDDVAALSPDFVLMVGDNVYADGFGATPEVYLARYLRVWQAPQFQALFAEVAAFATWDDHELVDNYWDGKNDAVFAFASRLYDVFQGNRNPEPLAPGERYYTFRAGDVGFFVLDTRTHRSPNNDPDGPGKSMLGAAQREALVRWLREDEAAVHVLVSSVLMSPYGTTGTDAWSAFGDELDQILGAVAETSTRNLLVVSGDQHWSAVLRLDVPSRQPYTVCEFQATPFAFEVRGAPSVETDAILGLTNDHRVFGVFDVDTTASPVRVQYTLCVDGQACAPGDEAFPTGADGRTVVPYSVDFEGGPSGLQRVTP